MVRVKYLKVVIDSDKTAANLYVCCILLQKDRLIFKEKNRIPKALGVFYMVAMVACIILIGYLPAVNVI